VRTVIGVLILEALAAALASLDVVPHHRTARDAVAFGLIALAALGGGRAWREWAGRSERAPLRVIGGALLGLLVLAGVWLVAFMRQTDDGFLRSRSLIPFTQDAGARWNVYVYEYSGIPDGFEETVVMIQEEPLPLMRRLMATRSHVKRLAQEGKSLTLEWDAPEGAVAHCNLETWACDERGAATPQFR